MLMTDKLEWDFPPTKRYHRRPRVEIMGPEEPPRYHRVEVTISRHRRQSWIVPAIIIVTVLVLWRFKLGLLMLGALLGPQAIGAALFVVALLGVLAWRERRAGWPF
jgi:hypothetical protein